MKEYAKDFIIITGGVSTLFLLYALSKAPVIGTLVIDKKKLDAFRDAIWLLFLLAAIRRNMAKAPS